MGGEQLYRASLVCPGFYSSHSLLKKKKKKINNSNSNNSNNNINKGNEIILFILLLKLFLSHSVSLTFFLILLSVPWRD